MEKILPINLNTGILTECWTNYRLVAILSDKSYFPWYIENFISYYMKDNFNIIYEDWEDIRFICKYDEVLYFEYSINHDNLIESIIKAIDNNGYILLFCDKYYISGSPGYHKEHREHDMLIYGYDTELEELYFIEYEVEGILFGSHTIKFSNVLDAHNSFLELMNNNPSKYLFLYYYNGPACAFYLKKPFNRRIRLEIIYDSLVRCLNIKEIAYKGSILGKNIGVNKCGISVYEGYDDLIKSLLEKNNDVIQQDERILWGVKKLIEVKTGLLFRLNYLAENNYIQPIQSLSEEITYLIELLKSSLQLLSKYAFSLKTECLDRLKYKLEEAKELDIKILTQITDILLSQIKNRIKNGNELFDKPTINSDFGTQN